MSAHVLLYLLNELGKSDTMRGLSTSFSQGVKINNTRAQMLDYIYHMPLELLEISFLALGILNFVIMYATLLWTSCHCLSSTH